MTKIAALLKEFQYTDYNISYGPHITRFLAVVAKFRVNLCFEMSEHSVQTADDNRKVNSQEL